MMKIFIFYILILTGLNAYSQDSKIYGVYYDGTGMALGSYNFVSGLFTNINALPGVISIGQGVSSFDQGSNYYLCYTNLGTTIINAANGNILNTFNNGIELPEFDPNTHKIYGIRWNGTQNTFVSFNLTNNQLTTINTLPSVQSLGMGESSFNPVNSYYLCLTNLGLTIINPLTGNIIYNNVNIAITEPEFNSITNKINGISWNSTQNFFVSFDYSSGIMTTINTLPNGFSWSIGLSSFDHVNGYYIIMTPSGIKAINSQTGLITYNYANPNGLLSIESSVEDSTTNLIELSNKEINVFYSSAEKKIFINAGKPMSGSSTVIFNLPGQRVYSSEIRYPQSFIEKSAVGCSGIYILQILRENKAILIKKLLVE